MKLKSPALELLADEVAKLANRGDTLAVLLLVSTIERHDKGRVRIHMPTPSTLQIELRTQWEVYPVKFDLETADMDVSYTNRYGNTSEMTANEIEDFAGSAGRVLHVLRTGIENK